MLRWYVTPALEPDKFLAGPYETRVEAARKCLLLTSELTKQHAADALSIQYANYYVPRSVKVTSVTEIRITVTEHSLGGRGYGEGYAFPRPKTKPRDERKDKMRRLSEKFTTMTHTQLLAVANFLDVEVNPKGSRFEIMNTITRSLKD